VVRGDEGPRILSNVEPLEPTAHHPLFLALRGDCPPWKVSRAPHFWGHDFFCVFGFFSTLFVGVISMC
jgi:hypothetical protein